MFRQAIYAASLAFSSLPSGGAHPSDLSHGLYAPKRAYATEVVGADIKTSSPYRDLDQVLGKPDTFTDGRYDYAKGVTLGNDGWITVKMELPDLMGCQPYFVTARVYEGNWTEDIVVLAKYEGEEGFEPMGKFSRRTESEPTILTLPYHGRIAYLTVIDGPKKQSPGEKSGADIDAIELEYSCAPIADSGSSEKDGLLALMHTGKDTFN